MTNVFSYLVEANITLLFLGLLFILSFRKLSFFQWNRFLLIGLISLCALVPFVKLSIFSTAIDHQKEILAPHLGRQVQPMQANYSLPIEPEERLTLWDHMHGSTIFVTAYLLITFLLLFRIVYRTLKLWIQLGRKTVTHHQGMKVLAPFNAFNNCSIFHYIIMDPATLEQPENQLIFAHEAQHILYGHTWDKLYMEIISCLFWPNPAIYWIRKELYQLHEYQVDRVVGQRFGKTDYAHFLLRITQQHQLEYMQSSILKNQNELVERINMLMQRLSPSTERYRYLLLIPCLTALILLFSFINPQKEKAHLTTTSKNGPKTIVLDPGHGGRDGGATSSKGLKEKDLTLQACKMIQQDLKKKGFRVILTHAEDEFMTLKDRAAFTGDLLVSIHFDNNSSEKPLPIGMFYPKVTDLPTIPAQSKEFALRLEQNLGKQGLTSQRPQESHHHAVLRGAKIPALIVNLGNLNTFSLPLDAGFIDRFSAAISSSVL